MANYVKGKWYKNTSWSTQHDFCKAKRDGVDGENIDYDERIYKGGYSKEYGSWGGTYYLSEASPEEYSKFLPDGHPDKISTSASIIGRWFECLVYGANGCTVDGYMVKKGDYVQIDSFDTHFGFYKLKNGNYLGNESETPRFLAGEEIRGFRIMPIGFTPPEKSVEKVPEKTSSSFVGRYLKALKDNANRAAVKEGQYYEIKKDDGTSVYIFDYAGKFTYVSKDKAEESFRERSVELMPEGFSPTTYIASKPSSFEMIHNNWYVIDNLIDPNGGAYSGVIGHVFQYDGKKGFSGDMYYASEKTTCSGACWKKSNLRPATPSEIEKAERKYFPEKFLIPADEPAKKEDSMMTLDSYDGYVVGSILYAKDLNKWVSQYKNYYDGSSFIGVGSSHFIGDRHVAKIGMIEDKVCFLVSGTSNVWILAEGYVKFLKSFDDEVVHKSPPSSPTTTVSRVSYLSITAHGGFNIGDNLDGNIVNEYSNIIGNQFYNQAGNPRWVSGIGIWLSKVVIHKIAIIDGYICYGIDSGTSDRGLFFIKANGFYSYYNLRKFRKAESKTSEYIHDDGSYPSKLSSGISYSDVDDGLEFQSPMIVKTTPKKQKLVIL